MPIFDADVQLLQELSEDDFALRYRETLIPTPQAAGRIAQGVAEAQAMAATISGIAAATGIVATIAVLDANFTTQPNVNYAVINGLKISPGVHMTITPNTTFKIL